MGFDARDELATPVAVRSKGGQTRAGAAKGGFNLTLRAGKGMGDARWDPSVTQCKGVRSSIHSRRRTFCSSSKCIFLTQLTCT